MEEYSGRTPNSKVVCLNPFVFRSKSDTVSRNEYFLGFMKRSLNLWSILHDDIVDLNNSVSLGANEGECHGIPLSTQLETSSNIDVPDGLV